MKIAEIKRGPNEGMSRVGQSIIVMGRVQTIRAQSSITLVEVNDGSSLSNTQCVMDSEAEGYDQVESGLVSTGASVWLQGEVVPSQGSKQNVELKIPSSAVTTDTPLDAIPKTENGLIDWSQDVAEKDFVLLTYTDAVKLLLKAKGKFEFRVKWVCDFQGEHLAGVQ